MKKILRIVLPLITIVFLTGFAFYLLKDKQPDGVTEQQVNDYRNARFSIEGQTIQLEDGYAEIEAIPGSASKIITRYFGNELVTDLNADGREDVAFIVTQEMGGTGLFYYAVGAIATDTGYVGMDGYLLGDRIAPQNTTFSSNERHKSVVVFNYAERLPDEPMAAEPSAAKSVYLKLDENLRWAIVEPNFEGEEVAPTERYSAQVDRVKVTFEQWDYTSYRLTTNELVREGELNTERGFGDDPDATVYVLNWQQPEGEHIYYVRLTSNPTHVYVLDSNREIIKGSALTLE